MSSTQSKPDVNTAMNDMLHGVSEWNTSDLEIFLQQIAHLLATRKAPGLAKREAALLLKIGEGYPRELSSKYNALESKLQDGVISPAEHLELIALTDRMEELDAERLKYLLELAQLRNISLDMLLRQLGLNCTTQM